MDIAHNKNIFKKKIDSEICCDVCLETVTLTKKKRRWSWIGIGIEQDGQD